MCSGSTDQQGCRIAILGTRGIPAEYGGFETFAEQLSVQLVQRGFEVTVYAESDRGDEKVRVWKGVNVQPVPVPRWGPASVIGYDVRCLWHARRRFDLVYMLGYGAAFACFLPRWYGISMWINVDGIEWARSKWGWLARSYLRTMEWVASRTATRIIADAQAIADRFRRLYPRGATCSYLAYGAPVVPEPSAGSESHALILTTQGLQHDSYFLVVARLEPENHVLEILQGYQLYRQCGGNLPLAIVGDNTRATPYCQVLRASQVTGVKFLGAIYDANTLQTLRLGARAYVHGHSVGGTNPSLLESLGCGNVVIAHDNPFNREVLGDDGADYFRQPNEIAYAMKAIAHMPQVVLHQRMQAAREIVTARYTWENITNQYEKLLINDVRRE
jgi:glycosyltransferase involved in cell wall biosynthesis